MLARDAHQRVHRGVPELGLDDHAVHDRVVGLHRRERFSRHLPLTESVKSMVTTSPFCDGRGAFGGSKVACERRS